MSKTAKVGPNAPETFRYLYSDNGRLQAETLPNSTTIGTSYIWLQDQIVGFVRGGSLYYVLNDHLGRPEIIYRRNSASSTSLVWQAKNLAFTREVASNNLGEFNIGFPGQYYDKESGLWYNWHRYYDASVGRYIQSDPIGLEGGINTYAYSHSNPLSYVDLKGLNSLPPLGVQYLIHYYRNANNRVPPNMSAAKATPGWIQMSPAQSVFHQQGPNGKGNTKWIDGAGHCEAVYNKDGKLVTSQLNGGTYNFASPNENLGIDHVIHDVIPYLIWGNGPIIVNTPTLSTGDF